MCEKGDEMLLDRRELAARLGGLGEIAAHGSRALRGGVRQVFGAYARIVFRHLLRPGEVGFQALQHRRGGEAADGEFRRAIQKVAPRQRPVHIAVEKLQNLGVIIARLPAFHARLPFVDLPH